MERYYHAILAHELAEHRQMAFVSGARQVGKTTLAKQISQHFQSTLYLNWDDTQHRQLILAETAALVEALGLNQLKTHSPLLVLDEIHKYSHWKSFLKGLFDRFERQLAILVTGSARMDIFKKGGDSLMGRYLKNKQGKSQNTVPLLNSCAFWWIPSVVGWMCWRDITTALRKEPKTYLWDWSSISDEGAKAENFVAKHLLKAVHAWTDIGLGEFDLYYLRTKDQKEVDFWVTQDQKPWFLVEVKSSMKAALNPYLAWFQAKTGAKYAFQVTMDADFVEADFFQHSEPIKVPARTFLSKDV